MAPARVLLKTLAFLGLAALVAGCSASGELLGEERAELTDFRLCYNIVTTNDTVQGPLSREADVEVFADLLRDEIERRFGRYQGDRLYHIAIHMDAYVLAVPGIPLVASPRSALIISTNLWDDQLGRPVNDEPEQMTVLESAGGATIVGSGLTQSAEEQMATLTANAALRIEEWMVSHPEWFTPVEAIPETRETTEPGAAPAPAATPEAAASAPAASPEGAATSGPAGCGRR